MWGKLPSGEPDYKFLNVETGTLPVIQMDRVMYWKLKWLVPQTVRYEPRSRIQIVTWSTEIEKLQSGLFRHKINDKLQFICMWSDQM